MDEDTTHTSSQKRGSANVNFTGVVRWTVTRAVKELKNIRANNRLAFSLA